jgi:hypothetical protein
MPKVGRERSARQITALLLIAASIIGPAARAEPWAFTGRVGTAQGDQAYFGSTGLGLSAFTGNVRLPNGRFIERDRFGLDAQWYRGPFGVMTEVSVGDDDGADVVNVLTELNLISRRERFAAYVQERWFNKKPNES